MTPFLWFFFSLLAAASVMAYIPFKNGDRKSGVLFTLLVLTLLFEILIISLKGRYSFLYDLFIPTEYMLFCWYYIKSPGFTWSKRWATMSVFLFYVFSVIIAYKVYQFPLENKVLITWHIDLEGFLLFILFTHLLFNIDDNIDLPIYRIPEFWVAVGVLIFNGGVFTVLGLYPVLLHLDPDTAGAKYGLVLEPLNILLYLCIITSSICLLLNRKFLPR